MLVVNLCGGAGCGKSTTRAGLFHLLKLQGIVCEEAIEHVKQQVYAENKYIFTDQLMILAEQSKILKQLDGKVWIAVSDSPLFLSSIYGRSNSKAFNKVVLEEFNRFNNLNILLHRTMPYQGIGRHGDKASAIKIDGDVKVFMDHQGIPYHVVAGDENAPSFILEIIKTHYLDIIKNTKEGR